MRAEEWSGPGPRSRAAAAERRRLLAPLLVGRGDVLVDDRLGAVREVAELRLPQGEGVGTLDGVAVLEGHRRILAEKRVVDVEAALVVAEVRQRQPFLAVRAVVEHGVALHERAAAGVLAGEAHVRALHEERPKASSSPKPQSTLPLRLMSRRFSSSCCSFLCTVKPSGLFTKASPIWCTTAGYAGGLRLADGLVDAARRRGDDAGRAGLGGVGLGERDLEAVLEVRLRLVVLLLGDVAAADERLGVEAPHGALRLDEVRHQRLRHRRVVALVVTATAVADEVDDDVAVELLAVGDGELCDADDGFGVVAVDVQDRRLDGLGDVGGVDRGAPVLRSVVKPTWLLTTTCTVPPVR
jgi:hypothetical protein